MDITPKIIGNSVSKVDIESVQIEEDEYKLIGKYRRTKGLRLFAYDEVKDNLYEVSVDNNNTAELSFVDGKPRVDKQLTEEATVDSRHIHFEALNYKNALKRLNKYKSKKIKDLSNLKKFNPDGIKFW